MHRRIHSFLLIFSTIVLATTAHAQKNDNAGKRIGNDSVAKILTCTGYNNPERTKYIKEGKYMNIYLKTDSSAFHVYSGNAFVGDSSLVIIGATEIYHGYSEADETYLERVTYFQKTELSVIPFKNIDYISYRPAASPYFNTLFGVSLVSAILVTPLAAISYVSKNFNSTQLLVGTVVSAVVSYTFSRIFKERKFRIKRARSG
jgi:hypothetical protein